MNKDEYIEIPEYLKNFPKKVQDFILDGEWEIRTEEIGIKYSLDDSQIDSLVNEVLYVLIGLKDPDSFEDSLESEVKISNLLSNQIKEELDKRVFEYAFRKISEEAPVNSPEVVQPEKIAPKSNFDILDAQKELSQSDDIEIRPEITPIVETPEIEEAQKEPFDFPEKITPKQEVPPNLPGMEIESGQNFIQRPVEVPRFTAPKEAIRKELTDLPEEKMNYSEMLSSKLQTPSSSIKEQEKTVDVPKYKDADPYREPIE